MTAGRRLALSVVGWVAIVAVGSTMVWTVVARAGRDVAEPGQGTLSGASVGASAGVGEPTSTALAGSSGGPSASGEPGPGGSSGTPGPDAPTGSASGGGDGSPATPPTADPTKGQPSTGSTLTPEPDPPPSDDPPPSSPAPDQAVRATWQGAAGTVVASCTGARISLVAAQPNSGWRVEVGDRGPEELSVHFELSEDEDGEDDRLSSRLLGQEVEIRAQCSRGRPSFSAGD